MFIFLGWNAVPLIGSCAQGDVLLRVTRPGVRQKGSAERPLAGLPFLVSDGLDRSLTTISKCSRASMCCQAALMAIAA